MRYREVSHSKAKIWLMLYDNLERCEIGCMVVLLTNRKWHTGFRLVPNSVTLNDLERRDLEWSNGRYFALFH